MKKNQAGTKESHSHLSKMHLSKMQPLIIIFIALALFFFVRAFFIDILIIKGRSMEPGFKSGDIILINRAAYGILIPCVDLYLVRWACPEPDDIVLFKNPEESWLVIKRCIAITGDPIHLLDGEMTIGNFTIPYKSTEIDSFQFAMESVPKNRIFVMGDNPGESVDSRHFGFISYGAVCGKAILFGEKQDSFN